MPFAKPWVSDALQNPPLRPEAPAPGLVLLEDDDLAMRVALFGEQGRPQPRVARADYAQVGR